MFSTFLQQSVFPSMRYSSPSSLSPSFTGGTVSQAGPAACFCSLMSLSSSSTCINIAKLLGNDVLAGSLNSGYIRKCFMGSGKDAVTLNEYLIRLKALPRWAYRNDYIADISYLDKIERFRTDPHRLKIQDKFLEASELSDLLPE